MSATGGSGSTGYAVTSGSLPSWLSLSTTGVLSGTPTQTGTASFTITATDSNSSTLTGSKAYSLTISPASSLTVSPSTLSSDHNQQRVRRHRSSTGGSGTYNFAASAGGLPPGLALNPTSGLLSGTPTTGGAYLHHHRHG